MKYETVSHVRIPAFLIDCSVIVLFIVLVSKLLMYFSVIEGGFSIEAFMFIYFPLGIFIYWVIDLNIGKKLFGIKVIDEKTGNKPTVIQCFIRSLLFSLVVSLNLVFLIPMFVSKKNRAFHDMLAGTLVIKITDKNSV